MTEPIIPAADPAVAASTETSAERSYTESEHRALVEAAIQSRFKNAPTKDEIAALKAKAAKADELEAAQMSELDKAKKAAADALMREESLKTEVAKARLDALKIRIGTAEELPPELAELLRGEDEDALKAHAATLRALIPKTAANVGGGSNPLHTPDPSIDARIADAQKRGNAMEVVALTMEKARTR